MNKCHFCKGPAPEHHNYCSWECQVDDAKQAGGTVHCPNDLPIRCIKHDNTMLEHEHGDHPDYKFPVEVEFVPQPGVEYDREHDWEMHETHALIYTDHNIAVTMYECCYAMWYLRDGTIAGGSLWKKDEWKLAEKSLVQIREKLK